MGYRLPDVYRLTVDEALALFEHEPRLARVLQASQDVGLGYLILSQPRHSLSGGECQRLRLARELCRLGKRGSLLILDEPTVGQHMEDVARLSKLLHRIVEKGNTVMVIEHQPHFLASCDWLVELGPGGGPTGGEVIATGIPEDVARGDTPTAPYLREALAEMSGDARECVGSGERVE
jgi:excinuclease ABC subunit A